MSSDVTPSGRCKVVLQSQPASRAVAPGPVLRRTQHLVSHSAVVVLRCSLLFEQGTPRFHLARYPAKEVAGPGMSR